MKTQIYNVEDLLALVEHLGFLPFFKNCIEGFSIEEFCPPELWFSDNADGPWEVLFGHDFVSSAYKKNRKNLSSELWSICHGCCRMLRRRA